MAANIYRAAYTASLKVVKRIRPLSPREEVLAAEAAVSLSAKQVRKSHDADRLEALAATLPESALRAQSENASFLGRNWLEARPTKKPLAMTDAQTVMALRSRLLIPPAPEGTLCPSCSTTSGLGHEDICRAANRRWIARHDTIARAFVHAFKGSKIKATYEPVLPRVVQQPLGATTATTPITTTLAAPKAPTETASRASSSNLSSLSASRWAPTCQPSASTSLAPTPPAPAPAALTTASASRATSSTLSGSAKAPIELRADFSLIKNGLTTYYDIIIIAINSPSAKQNP